MLLTFIPYPPGESRPEFVQHYGLGILTTKLASDWQGLTPEMKKGLLDKILALGVASATASSMVQSKAAVLVSSYAILAQPEDIWPQYIPHTIACFEAAAGKIGADAAQLMLLELVRVYAEETENTKITAERRRKLGTELRTACPQVLEMIRQSLSYDWNGAAQGRHARAVRNATRLFETVEVTVGWYRIAPPPKCPLVLGRKHFFFTSADVPKSTCVYIYLHLHLHLHLHFHFHLRLHMHMYMHIHCY